MSDRLLGAEHQVFSKHNQPEVVKEMSQHRREKTSRSAVEPAVQNSSYQIDGNTGELQVK